MLPIYLKIKGFRSYLDEEIDFKKLNGIVCLTGQNGNGKSTILEAISTALFYQNSCTDSRGAGMDETINLSCDKFEIVYEFEMNNTLYKIERSKTREGEHKLKFYINNIDQSEKITETQEKINNVIKMNYDTFLDTVCLGQGQSNRFMNKKPNQRKDVFIQVLGLDKYEVLEKYTKELKKDNKIKIDSLNVQISNLNNKINGCQYRPQDIIVFNDKINHNSYLLAQLENELESELMAKAQYEQLRSQTNLILTQRNNLNNKLSNSKFELSESITKQKNLEDLISNKQQLIDQNNNYQIKVDDANEIINANKTQIIELEAENKVLNPQAKELKDKYTKLKEYNSAQCNFCGHEITHEYKDKYLNDLMTEGKKIISKTKNNSLLINELIEKNNEIINDVLNPYNKKIKDNNDLLNKIQRGEIFLENIKNKIVDLNNNILELEKELEENLKVNIETIENKQFKDNQIKNQITQLRLENTSLENKKVLITKELEDIEKNKEELLKLNDLLEEAKVLEADYESLIEAYGKNGIQASIIINNLPEIETEINNTLNILCNGNIQIEFKTEKDNKKSKSKTASIKSIDTLDIIVKDNTGSRIYETYSGGEKFRVDFACHVGLAKFLAKRAGATIDFFMIDEGLGSQDQNAINQFCQTVNKLSEIFKCIMVITHIESIQDEFDSKILINKDPLLGSKVNILY